MKLHRRFHAPVPWQRLTHDHARTGAWFASLELCPADLAQKLRGEGGEDVAEVLRTVLRQLPPHIAPPAGRLVTAFDFI